MTELSKNIRTVLQTMVTSRKVKPKYDDDSFAGEGWLGLEKLHKITRKKLYRLKITLTSRNWTKYDAYYDWVKVGGKFLFNYKKNINYEMSKHSLSTCLGGERKRLPTQSGSVPQPLLHPRRRAQSRPVS